MIMVHFPRGGCVDDVVNNRTNYQFNSVIVIHFINGTGVGFGFSELFLMCAFV